MSAKIEPVLESTEPRSTGAPTDIPPEPLAAASAPGEADQGQLLENGTEEAAQREIRPIIIRLPLPTHPRTLPVPSSSSSSATPASTSATSVNGSKGKKHSHGDKGDKGDKTDPREQYTTLPLYPQPGETVQELKLAVGEWVGGYWLGPYSLRRKSKTTTQAKEPKLSEWMEVADVWAGEEQEASVNVVEGEGEEKELEVVFDAYTPASARQSILRLLDLLSPSSPSPISALSQPAGLAPSSCLFPLVSSGSTLSSLPSLQQASSREVEVTVPAPLRKGKKGGPGGASVSGSSAHGQTQSQTVKIRRELRPEETHAFADYTTGTEWVHEDLGALPIAYVPEKEAMCLREIQLSPWNPITPGWKARGHLVYLQVTTLEGEQVTLVCTTAGWYVSKITTDKFDPAPASASASASASGAGAGVGTGTGKTAYTHSLIDLLHTLSPGFCSKFAQLPHLAGLLATAAAPPSSTAGANGSTGSDVPVDPLVSVAVPQSHPVYPWLVPSSFTPPSSSSSPSSASGAFAPSSDPIRTQLAYLHTGSTSPDSLDSSRDWNEDLQAVRELPRVTMPERTARERMAAKIGYEFDLATTRAVLAVSRGEVAPLNPLEPVGSHMYLHSNIFITRAVDSISAYAHLGGDEAAHVFHGKDAEGVKLLNKLDQEGVWTLGHTVVDWKGERWVGQSVLPGIFSRRGDEAVAPETKQGEPVAEEGKKEDGWVDVTQSASTSPSRASGPNTSAAGAPEAEAAPVSQSEPEPQPENPLIIHGIDSEHAQFIHYDPASHLVLSKLGEALHLASHVVTDGKGKEHEFVTSAEVKALRGTDGRRYLLDLPRLSPVDVEWLENDTESEQTKAGEEERSLGKYPHRVTLLRPELVASFWESELKVWARGVAKQQKEEADAAKVNGTGTDEGVAASALAHEANGDADKAPEASAAALAKISGEEESEGEIRIPAEKARSFTLALNPDAFVDQPLPRPAGVEPLAPGSTWAAPVGEYIPSSTTDAALPDEASITAVRSASRYLRETVIPALVVDVMSGGVTGVMDGWSLGRVLKSRGVNMRYLGRVAQQAETFGKREEQEGDEAEAQGEAQGHLGSFQRVVKTEITFRSLKHILRRLLAPLHIDQCPSAIAHFLNCLLGSEVNSSPKAEYTPVPFSDEEEPEYVSLTPEGLREMVKAEAGRRFRYILPEGWLPGSSVGQGEEKQESVRKESLLRELAMRVGFQLVQRSYRLSSSDVLVNTAQVNGNGNVQHPESSPERKEKEKERKKGSHKPNGHAPSPVASTQQAPLDNRTTTFLPSDILTLNPLVKSTTPSSSVADEIRSLALSTLARGQAHLALDFLLESIQILENVHAVLHPDVAAGYNHYASTVQQLARLKIQQVAGRQAEKADRAEKRAERRAKAAADKAEKALAAGGGADGSSAAEKVNGKGADEIDLEDDEKLDAAQDGAAEDDELDSDQPLGYDTAHALRMQRQACIIAERTLGVWHAETAQYYLNLAMLENLAGEPGMALRYFRHCLRIWEVVYGEGNGEVIQVLSNAGIILQSLAPSPLSPTPPSAEHPILPGADKVSLHLLTLSSSLTRRIFGPSSLSLGHALHQLTQACFLSMDIPGAVAAAEEARDIFKKRLGEGAALTKEAERNLELLNRVKGVREGAERQMRELQMGDEQGQTQPPALGGGSASAGTSPLIGPNGTPGANGVHGGGGVGRSRVPLGGGLRGMRERLLANQMANGAPGPSRLSGSVGASAPAGVAGAQPDPRIGEKGHLELDELVKFIQGGSPVKGGAGGSKGKRRAGRR